MTLRIFTTSRLTAAKDGTLTGILLPWNEPGLTSKGKVLASRGRLALPDGPVPLNVEHRHTDRIGTLDVADTATGLQASLHILPTRAGQDAQLEIEAGLRACLSVEIDDPVIRSGQLVAGRVTGGALVAEPAFPSAVLTASRPDEGEIVSEFEQTTTETYQDRDGQTVTTTSEITSTTEIADPDDLDGDTDEDTPEEEEETMPKKLAAAHAPFGGMHGTTRQTSQPVHDKNWLIANLAGQARDRRLYAALSDVVPSNIVGIEQPQYVGELWNGAAYNRRFIPMFNHADLTSFKVTGWRWLNRPIVGKWEGDKKAVPSGAVETESVDIEAARIAGAHDIDRKFRDFDNAEFWSAYFAAMTESYAKVSDGTVLIEVKDAAPKITAGTKPAEIAQGLVNIVDGSIAILNETETMPTGAVVALDLWRDILLTPKNDILGYLEAAFDLEEGSMGGFTITPASQLAAGETLVTTKSAVTVHELGGDAPIRVEALDVAKGGIDQGVFGYYAVNVHDSGGLALVTAAAGGGAG